MVDGAALEKRQAECHPVPPDTISCRPARGEIDFCIWRCQPVLWGAKQFVGKMLAKMEGHYARIQAIYLLRRGLLGTSELEAGHPLCCRTFTLLPWRKWAWISS